MLKNRFNNLDKNVALSISGVLIIFISCCAFFFSTIPLLRLNDTSLHLDYSWQVYKGQLPDFYEGAQSPMPIRQPEVHFVSQHPPLYYAILAPFTGPLIDAGKWQIAAIVATMITTMIGVMCIILFAYFGWMMGGNRRREYAVAVAAFVGSLTSFIVISGSIFNDTLGFMFSILGIILSIRIIQDEKLTWRRSAVLGLVSVLGMASRISFASIIIFIALSVLYVLVRKYSGNYKKIAVEAIKHFSVIGSIVLSGIGWFYYRNYRLSGDWSQPTSQEWVKEILGRSYKSLTDVLTSSDFILQIPRGLYSINDNIGASVALPSIIVFSATFLLLGYTILKNKYPIKTLSKSRLAIFILLALVFFLTILQQLSHAVGYGALNMRYLLNIWPAISLCVAWAALYYRKLPIFTIPLLSVLGVIGIIVSTNRLLNIRWPRVGAANEGFSVFSYISTQTNNFHPLLLPAVYVFILVGLAMLILGVYRLRSRN